MTILEYKKPKYDGFISFFGFIMYQEYLRWIKANNLSDDYQPFVRFKFYRRENKNDIKEKPDNYKLNISKIVEQKTEIKYFVDVDKTSKIPKRWHKEAEKNNQEVTMKYSSLSECVEEASQVVIKETQVNYFELKQTEENYPVLKYDFLCESNVGTQTEIIRMNACEVSTQTEDQDRDPAFIIKEDPKLIVSTQFLEKMLNEEKHSEIKFSAEEVDEIAKTKKVMVDGKNKLKHQIAAAILAMREDRTVADDFDSDDLSKLKEIRELLRNNNMGDPDYSDETDYDSNYDSDFG